MVIRDGGRTPTGTNWSEVNEIEFNINIDSLQYQIEKRSFGSADQSAPAMDAVETI